MGAVWRSYADAFSYAAPLTTPHVSLLPRNWKSTAGSRIKERIAHGSRSGFLSLLLHEGHTLITEEET